MAGNKKPVKVLWTSSLTEEALAEAFANLHEDNEFDGVLEEAKTRAEMDYFSGMNYSRLLTLKCSKDETLPYGSCMIPLLNLIVQRERQIEEYQSVKRFGVEAEFEEGIKATLLDADEHELIFDTKEEADSVIGEIGKNGKLYNIKVKTTERGAPLLYSLPELQGVIGRKYKLSPSQTLKIAQSLYEKKLITYPRTDSSYLTFDLKTTIEKNLECCRFGKFKAALERCEKVSAVDDEYFNDANVVDHHAIIPAVNKRLRIEYERLSEAERVVFDEIVFHFLGIFSKPRITKSISVVFWVNGYLFRATESREMEAGYRLLRDVSEKDNQFDGFWSHLLDAVKIEENPDMDVKLNMCRVKEKVSTPPERYTYGSIIKKMEENQIGTPATMASTIDKLLDEKRPFLTVKDGKYYSTPFGRMYISIIPDALKDSALRAETEWKLRQVRNGELSREDVLSEQKNEFYEMMRRTDFQMRSFGRCLKVKKPGKSSYKRKRTRYLE